MDYKQKVITLLDSQELSEEQKRKLKEIFPELRENEDERIRKWLYDYISNCPNNNFAFYGGIGKDAVISYLEKQKEQQPTESTALQKAFINSKIDYTLEEKCDASNYADAILPTSVAYGENEEEYKLHKIIEAAFIAGQKKEQKPVISDEAIRDGVIHFGITQYQIDKWLKKHINVVKQQPAGWSEEDERRFISCMGRLQTADGAPTNDSDWFEEHCYKQPHWKPSEEQMDALEWMLTTVSMKDGGKGVVLKNLINDLKKQM